MFLVNTTSLARLAKEMNAGRSSVLERVVLGAIETAGADFIRNTLQSVPGIGAALRVEQGGLLGLARRVPVIGDALRMQQRGVLGLLRRSLDDVERERRRFWRMPRWQRTGWATSREDWVKNRWKHDWRSQPRNPAGGAFHWSGAWRPGRLPYPVAGQKMTGAPMTRKLRAQKLRRKALNKKRSMYRSIGRRGARGSLKGIDWSKLN